MKRPWLWLLIVAAIAVAIWLFFGNTIHAAYERRAMSLMENDLPLGLPRAEAYARIKAHGMVANNFNYLREVEKPPGSFTTIEHSDEWPQPGQAVHFRVIRHMKFVEMLGPVELPFDVQHPFVKIEFLLDSPRIFCSDKAYLKILFDKNDQVSQVQELPIYLDCSPL